MDGTKDQQEDDPCEGVGQVGLVVQVVPEKEDRGDVQD